MSFSTMCLILIVFKSWYQGIQYLHFASEQMFILFDELIRKSLTNHVDNIRMRNIDVANSSDLMHLFDEHGHQTPATGELVRRYL